MKIVNSDLRNLYYFIKLIKIFLPSVLLQDEISSVNSCGLVMEAHCSSNGEGDFKH